MNQKIEKTGMIETILGLFMDALPVVCAVVIISWAGHAYAEGYGLFVQKGMDDPGEAHTEMVTISAEDAGSALAVGRILEKQRLVSSGIAFAVKAKLSGYSGSILAGTYVLSSDMTAEQILQKVSVEPGSGSSGQTQNGGDYLNVGEIQDSLEQEAENKDVWGQ